MFHKVWSGHVVNGDVAWELLSLIDKIHLWALTEFRSFVLDHLRPWHEYCEKNYLLEWDSMYDLGDHTKRMRLGSQSQDLTLPKWAENFSGPTRQKIQDRAKLSLTNAVEERKVAKGKSPDDEVIEKGWACGDCRIIVDSLEAFWDHLQSEHDYEDYRLAQIRWAYERYGVEQCLNRAKRGANSKGPHKPDSDLDLEGFTFRKRGRDYDISLPEPSRKRIKA